VTRDTEERSYPARRVGFTVPDAVTFDVSKEGTPGPSERENCMGAAIGKSLIRPYIEADIMLAGLLCRGSMEEATDLVGTTCYMTER
jgi:hypothetical protein